jgi:hypothetical protein
VSALRTGVPGPAVIGTEPDGVHGVPRTAVPAPVVIVTGLDGVHRRTRR